MRLKSYFCDSVEIAIAKASAELGEDAMLVFSKEAAAEDRHLGRNEVVFATSHPSARSAPMHEPPPPRCPPPPSPGFPPVPWATSVPSCAT